MKNDTAPPPQFSLNRLICFVVFALAITIASQIAASHYLNHGPNPRPQTSR